MLTSTFIVINEYKVGEWLSSGLLNCILWQKFADASKVLAASTIRVIDMIMEATSTSETSVNLCQTTRHNNPEDSHLHTRQLEDLKPHQDKLG
jgi:hypothetical protein